jgi:hypothetical protein
MSSQARIAANKRNAARSTGPLTAAGKRRASRNARKHGLSVSIRHEPGISNKIEDLARAIVGNNATPRRLRAARGVAEAQLELRRLQEFESALIEVEAANTRTATKTADDDGHQNNGDERAMQVNALAYMRALPVLAKLDRYERKALSRYRRAVHIYAIAAEE